MFRSAVKVKRVTTKAMDQNEKMEATPGGNPLQTVNPLSARKVSKIMEEALHCIIMITTQIISQKVQIINTLEKPTLTRKKTKDREAVLTRRNQKNATISSQK